MVDPIDFSKMQEEETYIYLGKDGHLQKGVDLTVTWLGDQDKTVLVTANLRCKLPSDDMGYLKMLIGEAMSKYPLFEGLTKVMATKLQDDKGRLIPDEKEVGLAIKSGQHIWCDLTAQDLWINVRLEIPQETLRISFEVRLSNHAPNRKLKEAAFECAQNTLKQKEVFTGYYIDNMNMYRYNPELHQGFTQYAGDQRSFSYFETIGETFDFNSCHAIGVLNFSTKDEFIHSRVSSESSLSSDSVRTDEVRALVIRGLKYETIASKKISQDQLRRQKSHYIPTDDTCQSCQLL